MQHQNVSVLNLAGLSAAPTQITADSIKPVLGGCATWPINQLQYSVLIHGGQTNNHAGKFLVEKSENVRRLSRGLRTTNLFQTIISCEPLVILVWWLSLT